MRQMRATGGHDAFEGGLLQARRQSTCPLGLALTEVQPWVNPKMALSKSLTAAACSLHSRRIYEPHTAVHSTGPRTVHRGVQQVL